MPQYTVTLGGYAVIIAPDLHTATVVAEGITTSLNLANGELEHMPYTDWLEASGIQCIQLGLDRSSLKEDNGSYPDRHGYIDPGGGSASEK
jgi:hypothetical protein